MVTPLHAITRQCHTSLELDSDPQRYSRSCCLVLERLYVVVVCLRMCAGCGHAMQMQPCMHGINLFPSTHPACSNFLCCAELAQTPTACASCDMRSSRHPSSTHTDTHSLGTCSQPAELQSVCWPDCVRSICSSGGHTRPQIAPAHLAQAEVSELS